MKKKKIKRRKSVQAGIVHTHSQSAQNPSNKKWKNSMIQQTKYSVCAWVLCAGPNLRICPKGLWMLYLVFPRVFPVKHKTFTFMHTTHTHEQMNAGMPNVWPNSFELVVGFTIMFSVRHGSFFSILIPHTLAFASFLHQFCFLPESALNHITCTNIAFRYHTTYFCRIFTFLQNRN